MLEWARKNSHISIEEVAKKFKKSPEIIKNWEENKDFPTYAQLEKLAYEIYKIPLAMFFFPKPPEEPNIKKSFRTLPDFEFDNINSSLIQIIKKSQLMVLNLKELCNNVNPSTRNILSEFKINPKDSIIKISKNIRKFLNIELDEQIKWENVDNAFENWRSIFQDFGIFVFKDAFHQDKISGFCLYDGIFPIIYINNSLPKTRQIFTLIHELGHLWMRTSGITKVEDDFIQSLSSKNKEIEIFCNKLAGEFLVPDDDFDIQIKNLNKIDENIISNIAKRYFVSREVILRKLFDRKIVDNLTYEKMASLWIEQAIRNKVNKGKGNYYYTQAAYLGKKYLDLVFNQYYNNRISIDEAANYLNIKIDNISKFENKIILKMK